jgi:hypothetical protein
MAIAGIIAYALPEDFLAFQGQNELLSLAAMLLVGIPLYICYAASTPVAAALVLKGLSPGAALVLLLAGPATNVATLTVMLRFPGKRACALYLAAIAVCSFGLGWIVNRVYDLGQWSTSSWSIGVEGLTESPPAVAASVVLLVLIAGNWSLKWIHRGSQRHCECSSEEGI